jgi:Methyltransferase domain
VNNPDSPVLQSSGYCITCDQTVDFVATYSWLRDHFKCTSCGSIPRERALMQVIDSYFPHWRAAKIHESSPGGRGASARLAKDCAGYQTSQYFPAHSPGTMVEGIRCENLENLTYPDEYFDLHITQDVLEHVFHPSRVFKEIARTLKPGGMHIFTVPLVNKHAASNIRAKLEDGKIVHLAEDIYHGNPIGDGKSLVTIDWGYDICRKIFDASGLFTQIIYIDDISKGIRAEYIEVLVSFKPAKNKMEDVIP